MAVVVCYSSYVNVRSAMPLAAHPQQFRRIGVFDDRGCAKRASLLVALRTDFPGSVTLKAKPS
jgi:hypothetical protein